MVRSLFVFSLLLAIGGCAAVDSTVALIVNEPDNYLDSREIEQIQIPSDLENLEIDDRWQIPNIEDIPVAKYHAGKAPRPVSIVGEADPDLIRIQNLGDRSWIVIQRRPDSVWPLVRQFLTFNGVKVNQEDPATGRIVTFAIGEEADNSLFELVTPTFSEASPADFLVFRIEQGMRRGSSEVHVRYLTEDRQLNYLDWSLASVRSEEEKLILRVLAQFDVDDIKEDAVSRVGQEVAVTPKIELVRDQMGFPSLRLNVDFDRAWAAMLRAFDRSPYEIGSSKREERLIELDIDGRKLDRPQRELLNELLVDIERSNRETEPVTLLLKVDTFEKANDVQVVRSDGKELPIEIAEHFLITIQQYAS